ncbi:aspartate--tRNA ligase [Rhizobium leguminosarum]|uniref:aspartate--tRNA ligase n=1 Tax=Rhizobium leguminosarum TaxID=384 RepID=UPI00143F3603|nr:aspartate--tRNA ligase [Rhizobium leguminosarum]NKK65531.1 aspartate--tRNA ligase [Rhizobium leguminosarum bv. viciae]NKL05219.1 aspartate--tRNA ligase [Rhizobium leguminosarum bv. viciae]NKL82229.1 aspartate--tRNA ligase [Rhizobium leguminosarum bv. viciae]NKL89942.1 aspartate--tRNA ligase [Rhizobium leguminosarum bv. viciae]NKM91319.1 aspartate--tRNA ligase [Rhizobium leguminosarum bv. viciae]
MHRYRSHTCAALRKSDVGSTVRISGWVHRVRDHGGVLFIDLRDHYGITQVVADPDSPAFKMAETVRGEWVIRIDGLVKARTEDTVNKTMATGEIELYAQEIEVLSAAKELPLPVFGEPDYPEDVRLKYRFLDLRRETLHKNIVKRTQVISAMRREMGNVGFTEYTTPILTASSPEGARDFLVPSRIHPGTFYALPQAPQLYKQLLMVAGFDRYFQIAPCFRDEDPRADRLPGEFYQLDLEMSFVTQEDVWDTMGPLISGIFEEFAEGKPVTKEWPRIPYDEAIRKYGSDKPDLRNPIVMQAVTEHFAGSGFKVFAGMIASNPKVEIWAIPAKTGGSRAFCDRMNAWAQSTGQPGLGYIFWRKEGDKLEGAGPLAKNIGEERTDAIRTQLGLDDGDACFFVAGDPAKFYKFAGEARTKAGEELNLVDRDRFELCWIVDFPFFEWSEEEKKVDFAHNPFSMPQGGLDALQNQDPLTIKAFQYDAVCNGFEIASGSIRNQSPETMVAAFEKVGLSQQDVEDRFGGLYRAFQYGAPPHGGAAFGIDRIVMLLVGAKNLREISLFPMNQQAQDLLMGAPSPAAPTQLRELSIRPIPPVKKD